MRNTLITITAFILIINCSCSDKGTGPQDNGPDTTSRNFEWRADTLWTPDAFSIYMYDIWGSSPTDMWTVGHSDDPNARLWHWDGEKWQNIKPEFNDWTSLSHRRIFGFSKNDFWIVGSTGRLVHPWDRHGALIHYNYGAWELYNPEGLPAFWSIWGTASDNFYVGALDGSIYHYNGETLNRILTGIEDRFESNITVISGVDEYTAYFKASHYDTTLNTWHYYFYKVENQTATLLDSFALSQEPIQRFGNTLWAYDNILFSGSGDGVFRYENNQWQEEFGWTTIYDIYGSGFNNFFAGAYGGGLFHYNGENWQQITDYYANDQTILAIWCNEDDIFLVKTAGNYRQIVQGKRITNK